MNEIDQRETPTFRQADFDLQAGGRGLTTIETVKRVPQVAALLQGARRALSVLLFGPVGDDPQYAEVHRQAVRELQSAVVAFRGPPPTPDTPAWTAIEDELPPDEQFVLLRGPSGYGARSGPGPDKGDEFVTLGRRYEAYRPALGGKTRWLDVTNTPLSDNGWAPTHWRLFGEAR